MSFRTNSFLWRDTDEQFMRLPIEADLLDGPAERASGFAAPWFSPKSLSLADFAPYGYLAAERGVDPDHDCVLAHSIL